VGSARLRGPPCGPSSCGPSRVSFSRCTASQRDLNARLTAAGLSLWVPSAHVRRPPGRLLRVFRARLAAARLEAALRPLVRRAAHLFWTRCGQCRGQATPVRWWSRALGGLRAVSVVTIYFCVAAAVRTLSCRAARVLRLP